MSKPAPLLRIDVATGNIQVLTPAGLVFAQLTVADQLAVVQMVLQVHSIPPAQRIVGQCVDVVIHGQVAPPVTLHTVGNE